MGFFNSAVGQYIVQAVFHSAIIAIVAEGMISLWHIQRPLLQIKFRLLSLLLPSLYLPIYFIFYPVRGGEYFQNRVSLIDFNQWLGLRLPGNLALWHLFALLLALTTLYFLIKEAIPSLKYYFSKRHSLPAINARQFPKLDMVLTTLTKRGFTLSAMYLAPDKVPVAHTIGRRMLVISAATIDMLDSEELEATIAHELAHTMRQGYVIVSLLWVLRSLMFFNPVALLIFRRIINDNEKLCDDIAVSATGKRLALASALLKVSHYSAASPLAARAGRTAVWWLIPVRNIPYHAHRELTRNRVERIAGSNNQPDILRGDLRLVVTAGLLIVMLFFAV